MLGQQFNSKKLLWFALASIGAGYAAGVIAQGSVQSGTYELQGPLQGNATLITSLSACELQCLDTFEVKATGNELTMKGGNSTSSCVCKAFTVSVSGGSLSAPTVQLVEGGKTFSLSANYTAEISASTSSASASATATGTTASSTSTASAGEQQLSSTSTTTAGASATTPGASATTSSGSTATTSAAAGGTTTTAAGATTTAGSGTTTTAAGASTTAGSGTTTTAGSGATTTAGSGTTTTAAGATTTAGSGTTTTAGSGTTTTAGSGTTTTAGAGATTTTTGAATTTAATTTATTTSSASVRRRRRELYPRQAAPATIQITLGSGASEIIATYLRTSAATPGLDSGATSIGHSFAAIVCAILAMLAGVLVF